MNFYTFLTKRGHGRIPPTHRNYAPLIPTHTKFFSVSVAFVICNARKVLMAKPMCLVKFSDSYLKLATSVILNSPRHAPSLKRREMRRYHQQLGLVTFWKLVLGKVAITMNLRNLSQNKHWWTIFVLVAPWILVVIVSWIMLAVVTVAKLGSRSWFAQMKVPIIMGVKINDLCCF